MANHGGSQINALTSTRAVAAILVFIHHFGTGIFPFNKAQYFFSSGNIAVGYFFVLSGFVLYISYRDKVINYGDYFRRRVGRILPVYWLALLLTVVVVTIWYNYNLSSAQSAREITFSAFLVQAWIPSYPLCLNGPGWTISIEIVFYILFPFLLLLQKRSRAVFTALTMVLYLAAQYFHQKYYPIRHSLNDNIVDTIFFNPLMHISQFLIGMVGGSVYFANKNKSHTYRWLPLVLFAAIVLLIACRPEDVSYHVGLIAPVFMLFIISVATYRPRVLELAPLVFLGEISYGIYILQQPVYKLLLNLNRIYIHLGETWLFWIALVALIAISSASYFWFERPVKRLISRGGK